MSLVSTHLIPNISTIKAPKRVSFLPYQALNLGIKSLTINLFLSPSTNRNQNRNWIGICGETLAKQNGSSSLGNVLKSLQQRWRRVVVASLCIQICVLWIQCKFLNYGVLNHAIWCQAVESCQLVLNYPIVAFPGFKWPTLVNGGTGLAESSQILVSWPQHWGIRKDMLSPTSLTTHKYLH